MTLPHRRQLILAFAAGGLGLLAEGIAIARYFWG